MECKYVAFVGTDSYDLVHFITRTAAVLGCHCLAVDRTKDLVLMQSLPDDCDLPLVDYRGVDFTCQETEQEAVEEIYDYVFFYYGLDTPVIPDIFEEVCLFLGILIFLRIIHLMLRLSLPTKDLYRMMCVSCHLPRVTLLSGWQCSTTGYLISLRYLRRL